jgi:DNA-binding NtrC family response regulator
MSRILVVDDEVDLAEAICLLLKTQGHEVEALGNGEEALLRCQVKEFDLLVLDIALPGMSGTEVFDRVRLLSPSTATVFITAHGTIKNAVSAIQNGGFDYITKPFDNDDLVLAVARALERRRLQERIVELEQDLNTRTAFVGIVGQSPAIQDALRKLAKVARSDVTVLLAGETGTGKELAARSIHQQSSRAQRPFLAINCGAIPPTLAESELFGHERGAFTDAKTHRSGWFEQADQGILFLDEVGDLPLDLQVKLLRVLEEQQVRRIGSDKSIQVNVRVIAATNRPLEADIKIGRFREDLFWRLNVVRIEMPPLRERREDLPLLVNHLLARINAECRTGITGLSDGAVGLLQGYGWPGNVRELFNVLKHGVIMTDGLIVGIDDLPEHVTDSGPTEEPPGSPAPRGVESPSQRLDVVMTATEQALIQATLERCRGNQSAAAAALGITRRTLYTKLRRYRPELPV